MPKKASTILFNHYKIITMPIPLLIFNKIQKKKKTNAQYAAWASTFPMTDDCQAMESLIQEAQKRYETEASEYRNIKGLRPTKKAQAKRERDTLGDYINDMKAYLKDLQCGVQNASTSAPTPQPAPAPQPAVKTLTQDLSEIVVPKNNAGSAAPTKTNYSYSLTKDTDPTIQSADTVSPASGNNKKWIMYGVIAAAALLGIYVITKSGKK